VTSTSEEPYLDERLPGLDRVAIFLARSEKSAAQARAYNRKITAAQRRRYYQATVNSLYQDAWEVASNKKRDPNTLRCYFDMILRQRELNVKEEKVALMRRQISLLEEKTKALQEAVKNRSMTPESYQKILEITSFQAPHGRPTQEVAAAKLLHNGNGLAS
jgi:hypothetical protein